MSNLEHHNFPLFYQCELELVRQGYEPLNPARRDQDDTWESSYAAILETPETWESCIRRDVMDVLHCDSIILLPNWQKSRGASLELILSVSIGNQVAAWFPGQELLAIDDPSQHYDMAIDTLKKFGTISPQTIYTGTKLAIY